MDIETAIYRLLKDNSGVSGIVSGRIWFGELKQNVTYPAIAYKPLGDRVTTRTLDGLCSLTVETYLVFSADRLENKSVASRLDSAVFAALDQFRGVVSDGGSPEETLTVVGIFGRGHKYEDDSQYRQGDAHIVNFVSEFEVHYLNPLKQSP